MPPTLFSYCIPYDDGAAPNPFWGLCTLAICKPRIRSVAKIGDWIVGTGSVDSPIGDISGKVVYAMRVTERMTMRGYDRFTSSKLPNKIPQMDHDDRRRRCGDSIYDFSPSIFPPPLRPSVHGEGDRDTDLGGHYVLLSDHFFYFGDQPVALPKELEDIAQQQQGHRSEANDTYFDAFVRWIHSLGYSPATLIGKPQRWLQQSNSQPICNPCTIDRRKAVTDRTEPEVKRHKSC